jgi:hypothetical protein
MVAISGLSKLAKSSEAAGLVAKLKAKRVLFVLSGKNIGVSK